MNNSLIDQPQLAKTIFFYTFAGTLLLKFFLAAVFPMTGDEAFFYQWGVEPSWGYSDHPPKIGWWLAVLNTISEQPLVLRSLTVLLTSVVALLIVSMLCRVLPPNQHAVAWWMASIYLVMPTSWMFVLVTTDTPLILFMTLTVWSLVKAESSEGKSALWAYGLAGIFLGLAFLSKYFAVLLGIAFAVYIIFARRDRWWALFVVAAVALPFVAFNLIFNAYNGWPNILFNFINRHEHAQWQWQTLVIYGAMVVYLFTPWLLWRTKASSSENQGAPRTLLLFLWLVPLLVFLLVSFRRSVGLHWVLGFVPVFMVWAGMVIGAAGARFKHYMVWTGLLSLPHFVFVLVLALGPLTLWQSSKFYDKVVFLRESQAITQQLEAGIEPHVQIMARTYSPAAILAYHHGRYVPVFGRGRHHARQDDLSFDYRTLDGLPVRVFGNKAFDLDRYTPYFEQVEASTFEVAGVTYHVLDGQGFNYEAYRESYLVEAAKNFYQLPAWLPVFGQPFCERYDLQDCSPTPSI